uniref:Uncharacterized protein n=1 Tax=Arundo donax TaxID=35708 RepID=A0A0A9GYU6_ARUDO
MSLDFYVDSDVLEAPSSVSLKCDRALVAPNWIDYFYFLSL